MGFFGHGLVHDRLLISAGCPADKLQFYFSKVKPPIGCLAHPLIEPLLPNYDKMLLKGKKRLENGPQNVENFGLFVISGVGG
jgi:hypothetical protein